jgi:NAD(P)-dependent dehydrogenase (short-subunit alcohol dehydrogenase family)
MGVLDGKVAIVTGGGNGLGRAHALALAAAGAAVVVNDLGGASDGTGAGSGAADSVAAEIQALGGKAAANRASVADWQAAKTIIDDALSAFGRLDILVNNAGIFVPAPITDISEDQWDREISVHLKGTAAVIHHAAAHWQAAGPAPGRAIVNTSSPVGMHPFALGSGYCAAKAGIAALTIVHAQELASLGVRVNAIAPCGRTRMIGSAEDILRLMPIPADGSFDRHAPEHVSPLVVYLASPLCRFTGRVFGSEGGDIALYQPWHAADLISTGNQSWQVDALAAALADVPAQLDVQAFFPGGRRPMASPPHGTLKALAKVTG